MSLAGRVYRVSLRAYPPSYRFERGDEILTTLAEAHPERSLPVPGEVAALVRAGLAERNRADGRDVSWRGLASLALPLACVNAALGLAGLAVATSLAGGPGRWWPAFAAVAVALAAAVAVGFRRLAALLGLASLGLLARDAWTMAADSTAVPHVRVLEHAADTRPIPFPDPPASVPSNPTEILPFALVLALACLALRFGPRAGPKPGAALVRAGLALGAAAGLAGVALVDPGRRFAFLLVPALAAALAGLVAGLVWARAAVVAFGLLFACAPSVLWYLSASMQVDASGTGGTRDLLPGLIAAAALVLAAVLAAGLARRASRPHASRGG